LDTISCAEIRPEPSARTDTPPRSPGSMPSPSGASVESVEQPCRGGFAGTQQQELRRGIVARIETNLPVVFDEVDKAARSSAENVLTDIGQQRAMQLGLAQATPPPTLVTSWQMTAHLVEKAQASLEATRKNQTADRTVYDLLPSARSRIEAQAASEENKRLSEFISNLRVTANADAIRTAIAADLSRYRDPAVSEGAFARQYFDPSARQAVQTLVTQAGGAPDLDQFRTRVTTALVQSGPMHDEVLKSIKASLAPALRDARVDVASDQLRAYFPTLADRSWEPPESVIQDTIDKRLAVHDFDGVLQLPGVTQGGHDYRRQSLLFETETLAQESATRLVSEGVTTLNTQLQLAKTEAEKAVKELEKLDIANESEQAWTDKVTERVTSNWKNERPGIWRGAANPPATAATKYLAVFNASHVRIKEIVHKVWEDKAREAAEKEKQPERKIEPVSDNPPPIIVQVIKSDAPPTETKTQAADQHATPSTGQGSGASGNNNGGGGPGNGPGEGTGKGPRGGGGGGEGGGGGGGGPGGIGGGLCDGDAAFGSSWKLLLALLLVAIAASAFAAGRFTAA
jgi:uncharacterized membrane protein YgcG